MTYKASIAGLDLGGGKAVVIGDPSQDKSEKLFRPFGRFVNTLNGMYISAKDVGTSVDDLAYVRKETPHVSGLSRALGGSGAPSPFTALGVFQGMKAACQQVFGTDSLKGRTVAIQGLGKVGYTLAERMIKDGAQVVAVELNPQTAARASVSLGVEVVGPEEVYDVDSDILAPCALDAIINDTISWQRSRIIAGSANN
jgi:leucine dehydrogenase